VGLRKGKIASLMPSNNYSPKQWKADSNQLAIFGGTPAFSEKLHVGRPNLGDRKRFLERVNKILDDRWLTNNGPHLQQFEHQVAQMVGTRHCVAMCNATVALEIVIRALGLSGEVIVPSFTFIATAHALQWQEITPVFCDVDATTHNLDPERVEQAITARTSGIIGVHLWGRACDVTALTNICAKRGLRLIFDAAHAFGCSHGQRMVGSFGDAEVFSFHATKFLNSFEGGAVVTNDDKLADKMRLMRNFGFAGYDHVIELGTNGKMSEIGAAMGLTAIESCKEFIATNYVNYKQYQNELSGLPGVCLLTYDETEKCNYQYIVVEIDDTVIDVNRDQIMDILWAENVVARKYFFPGCHRMEPYRSYFPQAGLLLPETERLAERVLVLPTGTAVNAADITKVCGIIRTIVSNSTQIRELLVQIT
jgi:dTDP-4-amino-4,6-dideoxygalactose transaminase